MADTFTTNLNLTKPEPGAAEDTWGISLNSDLDTLDAIFSSSGTQVNLNPNQVNFADNKKAIFGTGSDLSIFHNSANNHSVIAEVGTGDLRISASNLVFSNSAATETKAIFNTNGAVELYHDNARKFKTTSSGIDVTGTATMDGLTVEGLSLASATTAFSTTANSPNASLIIGNSAATAGNGNYKGALGFARSGTTSQIRSAIVGKQTASSANVQGLAFLVHPTSVAGTLTEALLIKANNDIIFYDDTGSTQGFFWDASTERLGIGTTSPNNKLTVSGASDGINIVGTNSFVRWNSGNMMIRDEGSYAMGFHTYDGSTGQVERMRITSSGNVGIGTSSPNSILEVLQTVTNGDGASLRIINNGSGVGTGQTASLVIGRNFEERNFKIQSSSTLNYGSKPDLIFSTNQAEGGSSTHTEVLRIKNDGKVGIGTNAPADELHVNGSGDTAIRVTTSSTSLEPKLVFVDGSGDYASLEKVNRDIKIKAFNTDVAYFTNGGNVGIGTTAPAEVLHIQTANDTKLRITKTGTDSIYAGVNTSPFIQASSLRFMSDSSTERVRLDSNGNLLVGKTAAGQNTTGFQVDQNGLTGICRNNALPLIINRKSSNGTVTTYRIDNVTAGTIRTRDGDLVVNNNDVGLRFNDASDAIHPVVTAGADRDNLTDLGTSSARFKDLYLGSNIILSGTSANEGYIALPDSDLPTSTTHKLYHSNDTLYWNGDSVDTTSTSDYRAKKDIQPLKDGLERVNKLNPVEFRYIKDDKYSEGFIAHELQEVWEHGVHGEKDGDIMQSVSYGRITPLLVKAIQEQQEQIESLKSEIAKLKGE